MANQRASWGLLTNQRRVEQMTITGKKQTRERSLVFKDELSCSLKQTRLRCWCTSLIFMDEALRRLNIMSPADYYSGGADISSLKSLFHAPLLYYGADQVILCCSVLIGGDTEVWELWVFEKVV